MPYHDSMAIDTRRTALDLDQITATVLVEGVDRQGRSTQDPVAAVEGLLLLRFRDGSTQMVPFARHAPLPPVTVRP